MEVILKKSLFFFAVALFLATVGPAIAESGNSADRQSIEFSNEAVSSKTLDNGLVILAKKSPPKELISIDVKIMAGSSLEGAYLGSGVSHLVEHMVFKGTPSRKPGDIEKEIKSYGGIINGSVSQDLTDYNITVSSKYMQQALELLKDMLSNASFMDEEFTKEKEVIENEMRMNEDNPDNELVRILYDTAYMRHPYKYPPIGYAATFKNLSSDDALKYYKKMYVPNNMVIAITGGVSEEAMISAASQVFSVFGQPNYDAIGPDIVEPPQIGERHRQKEKDISLAYMGLGFHSTRLLDQDLFAMDVLSMILGRGNNSRLNTALVKNQKLAHSISCWNYTPRDPGLFVITAILDKEKLGQTRDEILRQIGMIKDGQIDDSELETARRMVLADYIFSKQSIDEQSNTLSSDYILTGSYNFSARYLAGIQQVTKDDVARVAKHYLNDNNMSVVNVVPNGYTIDAEKSADESTDDFKVKEVKLPNGLRLLARRANKTPTVSISVMILGGVAGENIRNNGISNLTAQMLLKGTASLREDQIKSAIESLGGYISSYCGLNSFGIKIEILKNDTDTALGILREVLLNPVFPEEELKKEKSIIEAMIKKDDDDIFNRGFNALRKELFAGSGYALKITGEIDTVKTITRKDIEDYYKRTFNAGDIVISVCGDINADDVTKKLELIFSGVKNDAPKASVVEIPTITKQKSVNIYMDTEQSLVILGFQTVPVASDDKYALDVLGSVLSGSSGRLFTAMRDKSALAYTLGCFQRLAKDTGFSSLYVATSKDKVRDVKIKLVDEINNVRSNQVEDSELEMAKRETSTNFDIAMQSNIFFSQNSAVDELCGLGPDSLFKYKQGIAKVTKEDVLRVARKYFNPDTCVEVVITQK